MSARSMTGFARVRRSVAELEVVMSVKSVNHRGLDLHFHMPPLLDPFEPAARSAIKERVNRGHIQVHVSLDRESGVARTASNVLNLALLESWAAAFRETSRVLGSGMEPDPNAALRVPGMLQASSEIPWSTELEQTLGECLEEALSELNAFRDREGCAIAGEMRTRIEAIQQAASRMEQIRERATEAFHQRLTERLSELLRGVSVEPQRLAQEAAILADRSDISEEIMRLKTHAAQLSKLLDQPEEKGKKLDFLLQEMNRETNTILSKTGGLSDHGLTLTELALASKAEIDKMREQSLNLE